MALGSVKMFPGRSAGKRGPYKRMGLLGLGETLPRRVSPLQRAVEEVPDRCPHCRAEGTIFRDRLVSRRLYCFNCDRDFWLVRPEYGNGNGNGY